MASDANPFFGSGDPRVEPALAIIPEGGAFVEEEHFLPFGALRLVYGEAVAEGKAAEPAAGRQIELVVFMTRRKELGVDLDVAGIGADADGLIIGIDVARGIVYAAVAQSVFPGVAQTDERFAIARQWGCHAERASDLCVHLHPCGAAS